MAEAIKPAPILRTSMVEWAVPLAAIGLIFVMLVPMPSFLLDLLLAASMTASVLVFLSAMHILRPAQFSVFPSLLLLLTLFRLSLNLASSRRILLHGNEGAAAAGKVIEAFGQFVVGGNYVVGFVLFAALIAIQYIVVSHGAVRTAEVTARFTLDALPGKQMAIDADLNAGIIDESQARARGGILRRDGRRGPFQPARCAGYSADYRCQYHCRISDRRISTRHSVSRGIADVHRADRGRWPGDHDPVAAGFDGRRHCSDTRLFRQHPFHGSWQTAFLRAASVVHCVGNHVGAGGDSGAAQILLLFLAGLVGALAWRTPPAAAQAAQEENEKQKDKKPTQEVEDLLKLDELALEVGYGLVSVVDAQRGGQLLARVKALRSNLAVQLGFIVPPVHITDNARLAQREYVIYLRGVEVARWELHEADLLAISSDATPPPVPGTPTREPAFGVAATWIIPALQNDALAKGYAVVDQTSVLATHLAES